MDNKLFFYQGNAVTFQTGNGDVLVNATEMAKSFGKQPSEWLRLPSTVNFLDAIEAMGKSHRSEMIKSINGVGTWLHEDVALEFARWLSPSFAIWCNDRIKELMKHGFTATPQTVEQILSDPDTIIRLATALKEERAAKELAQETAHLQSLELQKAAPKVDYFDTVLQAENTHTITTIAKELGMSGKAMNKELKARGIAYFQDGHWVLYAKYQGSGYTKTRTHTYEVIEAGKNVKKTSISTVWTEKGRAFIHNIFKPVAVPV